MPVDVERLRPGTQVRFPGRTEVVTLIAVRPGPFWEFYFDGPSGPGKHVLAEAELDGIESSRLPASCGSTVIRRSSGSAWRRDASTSPSPTRWRRVAVSNIQPLPHQLEAVYDCFLREPRLRFLLADDPGAGKTIMAGLYMKELILRRAGDRHPGGDPGEPAPAVDPGAGRAVPARLRAARRGPVRRVADREPVGPARPHRGQPGLPAHRPGYGRRSTPRSKDWDLAVIDEAHGFTIAVDGEGHYQQEERAVQGRRVGGAAQPPADPDDRHPALGARRQPVGAAAPAGPGRLG